MNLKYVDVYIHLITASNLYVYTKTLMQTPLDRMDLFDR